MAYYWTQDGKIHEGSGPTSGYWEDESGKMWYTNKDGSTERTGFNYHGTKQDKPADYSTNLKGSRESTGNDGETTYWIDYSGKQIFGSSKPTADYNNVWTDSNGVRHNDNASVSHGTVSNYYWTPDGKMHKGSAPPKNSGVAWMDEDGNRFTYNKQGKVVSTGFSFTGTKETYIGEQAAKAAEDKLNHSGKSTATTTTTTSKDANNGVIGYDPINYGDAITAMSGTPTGQPTSAQETANAKPTIGGIKSIPSVLSGQFANTQIGTTPQLGTPAQATSTNAGVTNATMGANQKGAAQITGTGANYVANAAAQLGGLDPNAAQMAAVYGMSYEDFTAMTPENQKKFIDMGGRVQSQLNTKVDVSGALQNQKELLQNAESGATRQQQQQNALRGVTGGAAAQLQQNANQQMQQEYRKATTSILNTGMQLQNQLDMQQNQINANILNQNVTVANEANKINSLEQDKLNMQINELKNTQTITAAELQQKNDETNAQYIQRINEQYNAASNNLSITNAGFANDIAKFNAQQDNQIAMSNTEATNKFSLANINAQIDIAKANQAAALTKAQTVAQMFDAQSQLSEREWEAMNDYNLKKASQQVDAYSTKSRIYLGVATMNQQLKQIHDQEEQWAKELDFKNRELTDKQQQAIQDRVAKERAAKYAMWGNIIGGITGMFHISNK